jgi:N-acetylneuraminate lyase
MQPLTGILAATYTAMHEDGALNLGAIDRQAHSLLQNGLTGAFICGTTGEGVSLSSAERQRVAECWVSVAKCSTARSSLRIVVHVGHNSLEECKVLAAHAQRIGADAIAAMSPTYLKPSRVEDLVSFCAQVAAAAPDLPFYYYHIPSMTGIQFPALQFLQMAATRIPTLAGAKYTDDDISGLEACVRLTVPGTQPFNMIMGRDDKLLAALRVGAQGAVGSTYNWMAPLYLKMIRALDDQDIPTAETLQAQAARIAGIVGSHGGIAAGKAVMRMIGLDCGPVRLPLHDPSTQERDELRAQLTHAGFFENSSTL